MKHRSLGIVSVVLMVVCFALTTRAQQTAAVSMSEASAVPKIVNFSGRLTDLNGKPLTGITGVTFLLYKDEQGGAPLWMETQNIRPDETGRYTAALGSTTSNGLPEDVFVSGEARWLAVQIQGQNERPRVLLVAVPYALKAHDAETIGGLPPSAFVLAAPSTGGVANSPATATSSAVPPPATAVTTSGGVTNKVAKFDGTFDITNSQIFDNGTNVGIGNTSPLAKLDVTGGAIVRGLLNLPATGAATATAGKNSQPLGFIASAFNSGVGTAVNQNFRWQAEPVNNNTSNASGTLNLLFSQGTAALAETGLKISKAGILTFAPGQSFPGTGPGTVKSVSSGLGLTGGPITSSGTLSINTAVVPQLTASNAFTGNQSITGNLSASGTVTGGTFSGSGTSLTNVNAALLNGFSSTSFAFVGGNNNFTGGDTFSGGFTSSSTNNFFVNPIRFTDDGVSGDLQQPLLVNAVDCCTFGDRMIWAHSPAFGTWGIYYDDSGSDGPSDAMHWQEAIGTDEMVLEFDTGNLTVNGAITAGTKDFKIDHPLDPTNKYLYHASVESSEMMNIYTGNAILDGEGQASVSLPEWFEALNGDFRYQLTAIGAAAPNLHIAKEIANHQFQIAGGAAGMKVSWQVTGVRHDAYAKAHPLSVEVVKPERERGTYMHPDAFGKPRLTQEQMYQQMKLRRKGTVPVAQNQLHSNAAR